MIPPGSDETIAYPIENPPGFYVIGFLVANPAGGWHWKYVKVEIDHIFKIDFQQGARYAGQEFHRAVSLKDGAE